MFLRVKAAIHLAGQAIIKKISTQNGRLATNVPIPNRVHRAYLFTSPISLEVHDGILFDHFIASVG
jgi:hypothetical protein